MEIQNPQEKYRDIEFTSLMGREIIWQWHSLLNKA